jgi:hypothetical protein
MPSQSSKGKILMPAYHIEMQGRQFGRLTVLSYAKRGDWECRCSCGTIKTIGGRVLRCGDTISCGCAKKERGRDRFIRHGMSDSPEYEAYTAAIERCRNPKDKRYYLYGERGIQFRFASFEQFYAEIGPRPSNKHSLDRIDNNGHYEPGNVRWATRSVQIRNQRPWGSVTRNGYLLSDPTRKVRSRGANPRKGRY